MIDTHCHLNFKAFDSDLEEVIKRAKIANLTEIVIPGAKLDSSLKATEIARKYDFCFSAIGIHPHHADEYLSIGEIELTNKLEKLIKNKKTVAVGEIGIDYFQYKNNPPEKGIDKEVQYKLFLMQLRLAQKNNLPVIIHCRNAQSDILKIISNFIKEYGKIEGVFHCFEGDKEYLYSLLKLGFYIGFDGNITYEQNQYLRDLVRLTPLNRLLLETDSPYLTPNPFRGTRNEPAYLAQTMQCVAQIYDTQLINIDKTTSRNAQTLFKLKKRTSSDKIALS